MRVDRRLRELEKCIPEDERKPSFCGILLDELSVESLEALRELAVEREKQVKRRRTVWHN